MNWTKTAPTKVGAWNWRDDDGGEALLSVYLSDDGSLLASGETFDSWVSDMGGEWLPLYGGDVLAAEVEKAWRESRNLADSSAGWEKQYQSSRAKRITTGETEPSL